MKDALARVARTAIQLAAAGGLTGLATQLSHDVPAGYAPYVLIGFTLLVAGCQNLAEEAGWIPAVLKPAPRDEEPPDHTGLP